MQRVDCKFTQNLIPVTDKIVLNPNYTNVWNNDRTTESTKINDYHKRSDIVAQINRTHYDDHDFNGRNEKKDCDGELDDEVRNKRICHYKEVFGTRHSMYLVCLPLMRTWS